MESKWLLETRQQVAEDILESLRQRSFVPSRTMGLLLPQPREGRHICVACSVGAAAMAMFTRWQPEKLRVSLHSTDSIRCELEKLWSSVEIAAIEYAYQYNVGWPLDASPSEQDMAFQEPFGARNTWLLSVEARCDLMRRFPYGNHTRAPEARMKLIWTAVHEHPQHTLLPESHD